MEEIIKWCNENNGFLTGLLSLLTVIVSIIAIVVSIKTARMPYKKSIVLTSTTNFLIGQNNFSGQVVSQFSGVSVNAANVGNRNIHLVYLGLGIIKDGRMQKMQTIDRDLGGKGMLVPTDVVTVEYSPRELLSFGQMDSKVKIYCLAIDSEGKQYKKFYGKVGKVFANLSDIDK